MIKYKRLFSELGPGSVSDSQVSGIASADYKQYSVSFKGISYLHPEEQKILKKIKQLLNKGSKKLTMDLTIFGAFSTKIGNKTFEIYCDDSIEFKRTDKDISKLVKLSKDELVELFSAIKACIQISNILKNKSGDFILEEFFDGDDFIKEMKKLLPTQTYEFSPIKGEGTVIVNGAQYHFSEMRVYIDPEHYDIYSYSARAKKFQLLTARAVGGVEYSKSKVKLADDVKQMKDKDKFYVLGKDNYQSLMDDLKEIELKTKRGKRLSSIRERLYLNILQKLGYKVIKDRIYNSFKVTVPASEINESRKKFLDEYLKISP